MVAILPFATLLHMSFGLYMLCSKDLLYEGETEYYKSMLKQTMEWCV